MSKGENLQDVLLDLGDYLQVINHKWDGHRQSYDLVVLFTGNMGFEDGDGELCQVVSSCVQLCLVMSSCIQLCPVMSSYV